MTGLTYHDTASVLRRIGVMEDAVLIGGQAVNFWAERYRSRVAALADGPFTSKDIDFQAGKAVAEACAARLNGELLIAKGLDDATPQTAKVLFPLGGETRVIDFLSSAYGVDEKTVRRRSIVVHAGVDPEGPRDITFRVMHPVDCLLSRTKNVVGLPGYNTAEALQQLRASIWCAREFIADLASAGALGDKKQRRAALNLSEEIFWFCHSDLHALKLFRERGVDVFDAVYPHGGMPNEFLVERYPRMLKRLAHARRPLQVLNAGR